MKSITTVTVGDGNLTHMNGTRIMESQTRKLTPSRLFGITDSPTSQSGCRNILDRSQDSTQPHLAPPEPKPFFSVVMTCNSDKMPFILEALESLASQTLQDFELIFWGTSLHQASVVNKFCLEHNIDGQTIWTTNSTTRLDRFSSAVRESIGKWIVVLDSDDLLHPDALWTVYRCLNRFPLMNYFCGSHRAFDWFSGATKDILANPLAQSVQSLQHGFMQRHVWGFRNDSSRWPHNFFVASYPVEDYWMFASLAMRGDAILHIPHILYGWRVHPGQWTQSKRPTCIEMCKTIQCRLQYFTKKQSPMWHWGDMALAARVTNCMVQLERDVQIFGDI